MSAQSRSEHILELAKELLDDIELGRTDAERLLLKASRLARWVGSEEIQYWLRLEMGGYNNSNDVSRKYIGITGRWLDRKKGTGYWGPLAQQEAAIAAERAKLAAMRVPDTSGEWANAAIHHVTNAMTASANYITRISGIRSRVLAQLHTFVSEVYYEKEYDSLSESIFERYKRSVDTLIAEHCGDVLEKIPSVMSRLSESDEESISQALSTCRRIIESFADSVFPPTADTIEINGNTLKLDASKHQNRINAFVHARTSSHSRKQKIRQNLANLFDRVSTGVHGEVTAEEAQSLFLNTYLFLGEILHLELKNG
jgi:AbiTii-like protein